MSVVPVHKLAEVLTQCITPWQELVQFALQGVAEDAVANRLRKTLIGMMNQSLSQYKSAIIASRASAQQGMLCTCQATWHP